MLTTQAAEAVTICKITPQHQWHRLHRWYSSPLLESTAPSLADPPWSELWRLVTILICVLPTHSKYVNTMTPQLQLLQPNCYEGVSEPYRYMLYERDCKDVLFAPVRCFEVGLRRDSPPCEDIFAVFPFVCKALPVYVSWDKHLRCKDLTQLRRLGYMDASVDTSAYQRAVRLRPAQHTCKVCAFMRGIIPDMRTQFYG